MTAPDTPIRVVNVQRFSVHDGPGIRTTVFLAGCPLRCLWCHNPEALSPHAGAPRTAQSIVEEALQDRAFYDVSGGGLTLSGGEPLAIRGHARALLVEAKRHGLHTCVQTSGAVPLAHVEDVLDVIDLVQLDLKHMDPARHRALTGAGPERVHACARLLASSGARLELRMPLVPGVNDDDENLAQVAAFTAALGASTVTLVPYHRLYLEKVRALGRTDALPSVEAAGAHHVARARERLLRAGVAAVLLPSDRTRDAQAPVGPASAPPSAA